MNRLAVISTCVGLSGLLLAMITALNSTAPAWIALGFALMVTGVVGAVLSAASSLARAWSISR
ncbi:MULTISPECIES: hypothetical protein [unclassified Ruegeria]|uniref:hypothetical protein n=1 Tax=unclassified Ruegeria TaxID=2625375 RepID=UPI001492A7CF|nr:MULTISPECIES: hypothetical protein [unclassified Ruegeria]NOD34944.1 hypothetical protein [Ruegeria sp. HKCCD7296]NOE42079.1 hypothetical protein [Ruegeria sp. HKCCD7319]